MTYEGPGQPTVRREQNLGFIADWEIVVIPVVSYLATNRSSNVDMSKLSLMGVSMGGYLAAHAAAFEPRIGALILDDGVYDVYASYAANFPPSLLKLFAAGAQREFDGYPEQAVLFNNSAPTSARWGIAQGLWSFHTHSPYDWLRQTKLYTLARDDVPHTGRPASVGWQPRRGLDFPGSGICRCEGDRGRVGHAAQFHGRRVVALLGRRVRGGECGHL